jgi:hypothetical protein
MIRRFVRWLRWGTISERVVCSIEGTSAEIEFTDRWGRVIGYWAYGSFDPRLPYQG